MHLYYTKEFHTVKPACSNHPEPMNSLYIKMVFLYIECPGRRYFFRHVLLMFCSVDHLMQFLYFRNICKFAAAILEV